MARSSLQRRQEAERTRVEVYEASLRRVWQHARPAPDFARALDEAARGFGGVVVREPSAWRPQMKTRDAARLRLAAARHLFARYPVAHHLEQVWIRTDGLDPGEIDLRKRWYIVAAGGGSLYREGADAWLSRKEVHAFLNPQGNLEFEQAFWRAIAMSSTSDTGLALRIAGSRIAQTPRGDIAFWREVVRFFCANPASGSEIDDLSDYLANCHRRDAAFALKGRTLASLNRQMRDWHRDLAATARIEAAARRAAAARARARGEVIVEEPSAAGSWPGVAVADWSWRPSAKDRTNREEFLVVQLKTAAELVAETRAMHHCVATYAAKCIAGHAAIFSLRHRANKATQRLLTIEIDRRLRAVQVRGFANRQATADERKLLARWSKARGVELA
ncbi:MAG: PcfJ domain-containing protein [Hyphomicrobiaceae bacterium]